MASSAKSREVRIIPVSFADEIRPDDSLTDKLLQAFKHLKLSLRKRRHPDRKTQDRLQGGRSDLFLWTRIKPSASSRAWARRYNLDARVTEVALAESKRVVRRKRGVLITETRHGLICANSGVDVSNVDGGRHALLLPKDPDRSAAQLHRQIEKTAATFHPVIITDSFGRPWREGLTEVAIGVAGMQALHDYRGDRDPHGYPLRVTIEAVADELACAAGLVCGKLARTPACIIRGFGYRPARGRARDLIRPAATDLFR